MNNDTIYIYEKGKIIKGILLLDNIYFNFRADSNSDLLLDNKIWYNRNGIIIEPLFSPNNFKVEYIAKKNIYNNIKLGKIVSINQEKFIIGKVSGQLYNVNVEIKNIHSKRKYQLSMSSELFANSFPDRIYRIIASKDFYVQPTKDNEVIKCNSDLIRKVLYEKKRTECISRTISSAVPYRKKRIYKKPHH